MRWFLVFSLFFPAFSHGANVKETLLLLYGGEIPAFHDYYRNAMAYATAHKLAFEHDEIDDDITYTENGVGKYSVVVIGDYGSYARLDHAKKEKLETYCKSFKVGMLFLYVPQRFPINAGALFSQTHEEYTEHATTGDTTVLRLVKANKPFEKRIFGRHFTASRWDNYAPLLLSKFEDKEYPIVVADLGKYDGIKRLFIGLDFWRGWETQLFFLDGLYWLSAVPLNIPDTRYFGVDVDDIFLPDNHKVKMTKSDVEALVRSQEILSAILEAPFKYQIGYNSDWYTQGSPDEADGDRLFLAERLKFNWFDHLPSHQRPADLEREKIEALMATSKQWATEHDILRLIGKYHVSPQHSGVFPVYLPLYEAWEKVWEAKYTSTVFTKQGFIQGNIKVAPRTDLGLPWNVSTWDQVGRAELETAVNGGFLFRRILTNPVTLFMTHQANYAKDRMATYLLVNLIHFVKDHTNLKLVNAPGDSLVENHFKFGNTPFEP